jgi:hypothetical protein
MSVTSVPRFGAIYKLTPKAQRRLQREINDTIRLYMQLPRGRHTGYLKESYEPVSKACGLAFSSFMSRIEKPSDIDAVMLLKSFPGMNEGKRQAGEYILTDAPAHDGTPVPAATEFQTLVQQILRRDDGTPSSEQPVQLTGKAKGILQNLWDKPKAHKQALEQLLEKYEGHIDTIG